MPNIGFRVQSCVRYDSLAKRPLDGFEDVVVLVSNLPAGPSITHNRFNRRFCNFKICNKSVFVKLLPGFKPENGWLSFEVPV